MRIWYDTSKDLTGGGSEMAKWFSGEQHHYIAGSNLHDHELDYGEFFTNYIKSKQKNMDRQRRQVQQVSDHIKKEQQRNFEQ